MPRKNRLFMMMLLLFSLLITTSLAGASGGKKWMRNFDTAFRPRGTRPVAVAPAASPQKKASTVPNRVWRNFGELVPVPGNPGLPGLPGLPVPPAPTPAPEQPGGGSGLPNAPKSPTAAGAYPFMVALVFAEEEDAYFGQYCGGTLIAPSFVLTAAHCTVSASADEIDIVYGIHDLNNPAGSQRIGVKKIYLNPEFSVVGDGVPSADFSILELEKPVQNPQLITLISDGTMNLENAGTHARVTGWGQIPETEEYPSVMQQVNLPVVDRQTCINAYKEYDLPINETMICAGFPEGGASACYGDSGGPLLAQAGGNWVQLGVVSWGAECGAPNAYNVFGRVSHYTGWINRVITGNTTEEDETVGLIDFDALSVPSRFEPEDVIVTKDIAQAIYLVPEDDTQLLLLLADATAGFENIEEWAELAEIELDPKGFYQLRGVRVHVAPLLTVDGETVGMQGLAVMPDGTAVGVMGTVTRGEVNTLLSEMIGQLSD